MFIGRPLVMVLTVVNCHPPSNAFDESIFESLPYRRP